MAQRNYFNFPSQKRSTNSKDNLKFVKECMEAALKMTSDKEEVTKYKEIQSNEELLKGKYTKGTVEKELNPYGIQASFYEEDVQCHPMLRDKVDLLVGEEWKRKFNYSALAINPDAISSIQEKRLAQIRRFLASKMLENERNPREVKAELEKELKRFKSERDIREKRANDYLKALWEEQGLKKKFNDGFRDKLSKRGEVYCVDIISGEPDVRKVDPETITVVRMGNGKHIDDADIVIEDTYASPGHIQDYYYEDLTDKQVKLLDNNLSQTEAGASKMQRFLPDSDGSVVMAGPTTNWDFTIDLDDLAGNQHDAKTAVDEYGNVRLTRMVWKSKRKVGIIRWRDEDGDAQKKIVDENYKPKKELGEQVNWVWINDWWETVRFGNNEYIKWGPRPIQFRRKNNPSIGGSGYIGDIDDVCLVDIMKPYQILYDVFMERTKEAFRKSKGKIMPLELSFKPEKWSVEQWLYYIEAMGFYVTDSFNEPGRKHEYAGHVVQQGHNSIDLEMSNYVQLNLSMLQYIESRIGEIVGITKHREGTSTSQTTATEVQSSVQQSYHITEPYFAQHDHVKERVLETLLETAKWCARNNKKLFRYITDDLSGEISELDGDVFNEMDFGIFVTSSAQDHEYIQNVKQLAHAAIQRGEMDLAMLGRIYSDSSVTSIRRRIEESTERSRERQEAQDEANRESAEKIKQMELQNNERDRQVDIEKEQMSNDTDVKIKLLDIESKQLQEGNKRDINIAQIETQLEKLKVDKEKADKELKLKEKEINKKPKPSPK